MATASELLAMTANSGDDKTLIIDNDLRTINIPESITNLGVEADNDVHRLYFQMPRYLGETDLSDLNVRINYMNAKKEGDIYVVTDKKVLSSTITFSWLVGPNALMYNGTVKFIVCLKKSDTEGNVLKEFNTTVATLPVLEGLEVDTYAVSYELMDVLEQLQSLTEAKVSEVETAGTEQIAKVSAKSVEEQENIANKGVEVLATIPEDYQTTSKLADEGVRTKADAIVCSAEGEVVTVIDSSDDCLRGLQIFGKSTQFTTTGAQLISTTLNGDMTVSGITVSPLDDGNLQVNGTHVEGAMWLEVGKVSLVAGKTYTLSCADGFSIHLWDSTNNKEFRTKKADVASIVIEMTESIDCAVVLNDAVLNRTYSKVSVSAMLNEGSTALPWEPFTGGMPAPNPDYPQEIVSVGENGINVNLYTSNLLDADSFTVNNNTSIAVSDDHRTITAVGGTTSGWCSSTYFMPEALVKALRGKAVYLACDSFTTAQTVNVRMGLNITRENGHIDYPDSLSPTVYSRKLTISETATKIQVCLYTNNSGSGLDTDNTVIVKGLRMTLASGLDWEAYNNQNIAYTASILHGIPVTSGGNYTDSDGQQWICDEVDFERGVYVQRIKHVVLDGSDKFDIAKNHTDTDRYLYTVYSLGINTGIDGRGYCSSLPYNTANAMNAPGANTIETSGYSLSNSYSVLYINVGYLMTENSVAALRDMLSANPITFLAAMKTPIETPLTAAEIEAFKALSSNYHNTTILNDSGAKMIVRYNADTETWIKNLIDERIAAAIANIQ